MTKRRKPKTTRQNVTLPRRKSRTAKGGTKSESKPRSKRPTRPANVTGRTKRGQRAGKSTSRGTQPQGRAKLAAKISGKNKRLSKPVRQSRKNPTSKNDKAKPSKVRRGGTTQKAKPRVTKQNKRGNSKRPKLVAKPRKAKISRKVRKGVRKEQFTFQIDLPNNRIDIFLPSGSFAKKLEAVRNSPFDCLTPLQEKQLHYNEDQKQAVRDTGKPYLPYPQAVVITLTSQVSTGKADEKKEFFRNKITDLNYIINNDNVKKFVIDRMVDYQDNWLEMKEEVDPEEMADYQLQADPKRLHRIRIIYIW